MRSYLYSVSLVARRLVLVCTVSVASACSDGTSGSVGPLAVESVGELWADEDCWSLVVCYRGFNSAEMAGFMNSVGGGIPSGMSAEDTQTCTALRTHLLYLASLNEIGVWTQPVGNANGLTDLPTGRVGMRVGFTSSRFELFHEAWHSVMGLGDNSMHPSGFTNANYNGRMCSVGHL